MPTKQVWVVVEFDPPDYDGDWTFDEVIGVYDSAEAAEAVYHERQYFRSVYETVYHERG